MNAISPVLVSTPSVFRVPTALLPPGADLRVPRPVSRTGAAWPLQQGRCTNVLVLSLIVLILIVLILVVLVLILVLV